jgi:hypothetical protein
MPGKMRLSACGRPVFVRRTDTLPDPEPALVSIDWSALRFASGIRKREVVISEVNARLANWFMELISQRTALLTRSSKGEPFRAGRNKKQHRGFRPTLAKTIEPFLCWEENRGDASGKDHDDTSCSSQQSVQTRKENR